MSRNLRNRNHPAPNPVSSYEVAPHRYLWTGTDDSYRDAPTYKEFIAGVPYRPGEVVWLEVHERNGEKVARLAYISDIYKDSDYYERYGERREKYRVHVATKKGDRFAKNWIYTHPGYVQRGYKLAGLAPEMPE